MKRTTEIFLLEKYVKKRWKRIRKKVDKVEVKEEEGKEDVKYKRGKECTRKRERDRKVK